MESVLGRVGLWFGVLLLAVVAIATTQDAGFAVHATIVAVAAFGLIWATAGSYDPMARAQSLFRMPDAPSRYDDEVIRWGVLATIFWGIAGLL
ncbi:MAG: hypothetical protein B7X57_04255, partial [Erythrobacter sp. 34-65-8]